MLNLNVIAAVALNGVIGDSHTNSIPWKISADFKHFKKVTTGKTVIMGSTTFKSLPNGQALPNRRNVVITKHAFHRDNIEHEFPGIAARGAYISLAAAIFCESGEKWVIGGGKLYAEALRWLPETLNITVVDLEPEGDVKFPFTGRELDAAELAYQLPMSGRQVVYRRVKDGGWQEEDGTRFKFIEFLREGS
jgi:dihydrofolate reductase